MKRSSVILLQTVVVALGIGALALLLWEPHLEGRNVNATLFEIYFNDPFLALVYIGSIPFFAALYQVLQLLRCAGQNKIFSKKAVRSLRIIKYCAIAVIGFVIIEEAIIMLNHGNDDAAGGVFVGILVTFGSIVIATAAALFERNVGKAIDAKSESDLPE